MPEPTNTSRLLAGLAVGLGLGAAAGMWWARRIPGHIFRDGDDWYVDEPVLRELQRRLHWSGGAAHGGYSFALFGQGSIKLVPSPRTLPRQNGPLFAVQPLLSAGQTLEFVMLDLALHRAGKLELIRYTPRPMPGRMVQGPGVDSPESPNQDPPDTDIRAADSQEN